MKKIYALLFIFLYCLQVSQAQHRPGLRPRPGRVRHERAKRPERPHREYLPAPLGFNIGTNLVALMESDGGPGVSAEYRFAQKWSVELELKSILYDASGTFPGDKGYRIRPELRYFFPGRKGHVYHWFTGIQLGYKKAVLDQEWYSTHQGLDLDTYQQIDVYRCKKENWEGAVKLGAQYYFGSSQHFMFEWSVGMGIKHRTFTYLDPLPENAVSAKDLRGESFSNTNYLEPDVKWQVHVPVMIKFGYRF